MTVLDLFVLAASGLFGTKHLIAYALVIIVVVAAVALMARRSSPGR